MKKQWKSCSLLMLTAVIWGFAFVAQRLGAEFLGAFSFNGIRFALGALSLLPVILLFGREPLSVMRKKRTMLAAFCGGLVLFTASALQQWGIAVTESAGKAGFVTGLYIVIVPILSFLLWKKKTGLPIWIGAILAVIGLYLLSMTGMTPPGLGDLALIAGAVLWAAHILIIDYFTARDIHVLWFACGQFTVCAVLNLIGAALFEELTLAAVSSAAVPLLYGGLMSVGVAYTLQILGQKDADPTAASIILSTESVFSAIGGALFLKETMTVGGYIGCLLIFAGIVLAQLPADTVFQNTRKKKKEKKH